MHGLQACLFKYITVAAFHIYALCGDDAAKRGGWSCASNSHENYIVDHGKSWNCVFEFLWEPCQVILHVTSGLLVLYASMYMLICGPKIKNKHLVPPIMVAWVYQGLYV